MEKIKTFLKNFFIVNYIFLKKNLSHYKTWWLTATLLVVAGFGILLSLNFFSLNEIHGGAGELLSLFDRLKLLGLILLAYSAVLLVYYAKRHRFFRNYFK